MARQIMHRPVGCPQRPDRGGAPTLPAPSVPGVRTDRSRPRGESARVAARVRQLLAEHDGEFDEPRVDSGTSDDRFVGYDLGTVDEFDAADDDADVDGGDLGRPGFRRPPIGHAAPSAWDRALARVPVRLDPGRRGALAVGVAVLLAAVVTGVWLMSARPRAVPVSASVPSVAGASALVGTDGAPVPDAAAPDGVATPGGTSTSAAATSEVVVDVAGKVRHPGVYRLPAGSRVDDALTAAGGAVGHVDLSNLNLAALLADGQQIAVGVAPAAAAAGGAPAGAPAGAAPAAGAASGTVVDLNTASLEQLESLPGVGPVLGQHILDYRTAHGPFSDIEQLKDVSGIGDVTFADLKALVTV